MNTCNSRRLDSPVPPTLGPPPRGRTLHLVDLENLLGRSHREASFDDVAETLADYQRLAGHRPGDLAIIGTNPSLLALHANQAWPSCQLVTRPGPHGAELAIVDRVDHHVLAHRFASLAIGSGDGFFADLAREACHSRLFVQVLTRRGSLASVLARHAHRITFTDRATAIRHAVAA